MLANELLKLSVMKENKYLYIRGEDVVRRLSPSLPSPSLSLLLFTPHSLLADLQTVAAVADLEEEPLEWRAAHPRKPVVFALAGLAEAQ